MLQEMLLLLLLTMRRQMGRRRQRQRHPAHPCSIVSLPRPRLMRRHHQQRPGWHCHPYPPLLPLLLLLLLLLLFLLPQV